MTKPQLDESAIARHKVAAMTPLPRAILFDLDDTLISAYSRPEAAWQAVCTEFSDHIAPLAPAALASAVLATAHEFWADPRDHREWRLKLRLSRREIVRRAFRRLAMMGHALPDDVIERLADRFSDYRDEQMRLFPNAHEVVDAFRAAGVHLALVTNGAGVDQRAKITRFDLLRRFDHIQIEGEHDFGKPDERAYRHAMAVLGVTPRDTWMIGDNLDWEVRAPKALGIYTIWHDVMGAGLPAQLDVKPDRIIRALAELLSPD
jgi:putative hydrolase of the HAD superfamily